MIKIAHAGVDMGCSEPLIALITQYGNFHFEQEFP